MFGRGAVVVAAAALLVRVNLCTCFIDIDILGSVCVFGLMFYTGELRDVRDLIVKPTVDS